VLYDRAVLQAVSVSLGSPSRDKTVEISLLGRSVRLSRIGTNGDEEKARALYREMDGVVDALGVGGIDLHVHMPWKSYPLHGALRLVQDVRRTPVVDGTSLRRVLERKVVQLAESRIGSAIPAKKAFLVEAISRAGMLESFLEAGYECVYGDLMFALGIPIALRSLRAVYRLARLLLPLVGHLPISFLYSTGESQEVVVPKYERLYKDASVIAGDWLYIKKHMPDDMQGKVIVTNTTTAADIDFMRRRGIRYAVTTTPVYQGRSFGTNALEAALTAAAGKGRALSPGELADLIREIGLESEIREVC
jgi:hypothetical protein